MGGSCYQPADALSAEPESYLAVRRIEGSLQPQRFPCRGWGQAGKWKGVVPGIAEDTASRTDGIPNQDRQTL